MIGLVEVENGEAEIMEDAEMKIPINKTSEDIKKVFLIFPMVNYTFQ